MVKIFLAAILAITVLAVQPPVYAFDFFNDNLCSAKNAGENTSPVCQQAAQQKKQNPVTRIINDAANIIALISGLLAVIMIIISGFSMVTSAGNSEQISGSRRRIVSALIGLVIIALAWTLVRFVTDRIIQ